MPFGSWPLLVKRGGLAVLPHVPVHERAMKTTCALPSLLGLDPSERALPLLTLGPRVGQISHLEGVSRAELLPARGSLSLDLHSEADRLDREVRKPGYPLADQPHF
jgi:hypothetical protein